MRTITYKGCNVVVYDSPETMPMRRYQRFNKFLMIDNEVGADFADFNKRSTRAIEYLKKGMQNEAIKELDNRRQMVYNSFQEYSPKGRAFAILVYSINGKIYNDYSSSGLDKINNELEAHGITYELIDSNVKEVKKKSRLNLKHILGVNLAVLKGSRKSITRALKD